MLISVTQLSVSPTLSQLLFPSLSVSLGPYLVVESCQHKALQGNYEFVYGLESSRRLAIRHNTRRSILPSRSRQGKWIFVTLWAQGKNFSNLIQFKGKSRFVKQAAYGSFSCFLTISKAIKECSWFPEIPREKWLSGSLFQKKNVHWIFMVYILVINAS